MIFPANFQRGHASLTLCRMASRRTGSGVIQSMKLLVDMNLSPRWVGVLVGAGFQATHWTVLGVANTPDSEIMALAPHHDLPRLPLY